jgi:hypothetical protein
MHDLQVLPQFDNERAMSAYRDVIERRRTNFSPEMRDLFNGIAKELRGHWRDRHGEDTLHQATFGPAPTEHPTESAISTEERRRYDAIQAKIDVLRMQRQQLLCDSDRFRSRLAEVTLEVQDKCQTVNGNWRQFVHDVSRLRHRLEAMLGHP